MASAIYPSFRTDIMNGGIDLDSDTLKVMLVTSSYTYSAEHTRANAITGEVANGNGYATGGAALGSKSVVGGVFDASDASWPASTITARGAVIYKSTGTAANDPLIAYIDFGENKASSNGEFKILWNNAGILSLS